MRYFDPALGRFVEQEGDAPAVSRETEGPLAEAHAIERDAELRAFLKEGGSSESESAASFAKLLAKDCCAARSARVPAIARGDAGEGRGENQAT